MSQTRTLLYSFLRPGVSLATCLLFRKIVVIGRENIPKDRQVILVSNHQNAMIDPIVLCVVLQRQLHWLTRADVFKKPMVNLILRNINMLPVYRERDRVADLMDKNNATFEVCYQRLKHKALICIFPEGGHRGKKELVSIKKGVSRLVMGAIDSGAENLCVVPVGLDYEDYYNYRKNVVIHFGTPIDCNSYRNLSTLEKPRAQTEIMQVISEGLIKQMIHISTDEVYHEIMDLRPLCDKISGSRQLKKQFIFFKHISDKLNRDNALHSRLKSETHAYTRLMHELHISEDLYREKQTVWSYAMLILLFPFMIVAFLVYNPIYKFGELMVKKLVKDPLFKNSIRLGIWIFVTPFWWLLCYLIMRIFGIGSSLALLVLAATIVCGLLALQWLQIRKLFMQHIQCNRIKKMSSLKFQDWVQKRNALMQWIKELN